MDRQTYAWFDYLRYRMDVLERKVDAVLVRLENPDPEELAVLKRAIETGSAKAAALKAVIEEAPEQPQSFFKESDMPTNVQEIDDLVTSVEAENTVIDGAIAYIKGVPALVQKGIDAALAGGATKAQLQTLVDIKAGLDAKKQAVTDALVAGTPTPTVAAARQHKP